MDYGNANDNQEQAVTPEAAVEQLPNNEVGGLLGQLASGTGLDINHIASMAGISTNDMNALSNGDLMQLIPYVAQHHPEILEPILARFPMARFLIPGGGAAATGGGGLGGLLGGLLGGNR